jgi:hypothetical protein
MKVIKILYVRTPQHRTPIGCVVLLEDGRIGWSQCCPKDQFSKTKAKEIAYARALKDDITLPFGTEKKPVLVKVIVNQFAVNNHWHYVIHRVDLVSEAINRMCLYYEDRKDAP